jgi:hypothetical protein
MKRWRGEDNVATLILLAFELDPSPCTVAEAVERVNKGLETKVPGYRVARNLRMFATLGKVQRIEHRGLAKYAGSSWRHHKRKQ